MAGERAARPAFPARAFHRQEGLDPAVAIALLHVPVDRDGAVVAREAPFEAAQARTRLGARPATVRIAVRRSEEHTSELQSLMRISYAVFCLQKKKKNHTNTPTITQVHR